jgi:hypothetical protein
MSDREHADSDTQGTFPIHFGQRMSLCCGRWSWNLVDGWCPDCDGRRDEHAYIQRRDAAIKRLIVDAESNPVVLAARAEADRLLEKSRAARLGHAAGRAGR